MVPETTHSPPGGASDDHVEREPAVTLDLTATDTTTALTDRHIFSGATRVRLDSMERAILHARIAALERALEAKDRQRAAIIDQYETIQAELERTAGDDAVSIAFEDDTSTGQRDGLLGGLSALLDRD